MPRQYNLRWRDSDQAELNRAVKNFNAKLAYIEKTNPEIKNALPARASVKQIKDLISTRQDLNRELNALRRFSARGAEELVDVPDNEYNLKITKWQKEEMTRRVGVINRRRRERYEAIQDVEMKDRGETLGYTVGQAREFIGMGSADANAAKAMNAFTPSMTRNDLQYKWRAVQKESQDTYWNKREQTMKDTYVKTLQEEFFEDDVEDIVGAIDDMPFPEFYERFAADAGRYEWAYPGEKDKENPKYQEHLRALRTIWTS